MHGSLRTCISVVHGLMWREAENVDDERLELAPQQGGARRPSVLSGMRCLSSRPHCPGDLVAKGLEFSSEARSHLRVALSRGVPQNAEESERKTEKRSQNGLWFPFWWRLWEAHRTPH